MSLPKELNGSPAPLIKMIAPAGKLGVVFENKTGGGCHVKSVKGSSRGWPWAYFTRHPRKSRRDSAETLSDAAP